jgi:hypothetical protein
MLLQEVKAEAFKLPPSDRLMLVTAIIESLQDTAVSADERSRAIQQMRGLLKTDRPAPTDAEVAAMLVDRREEKYQMTSAYVPTPAYDSPAQQGQDFQALLQPL